MYLRFLYNILSFVALAVLTAACGDSGHGDEPAAMTHRTVLVYMVADNSLGTYGNDRSDFEEMQKAAIEGALNGGRLLVYYNRPGTENGNAPQLIEVTANGLEILKTYPDDPSIYSVDASRMAEAFTDMKRFAPALDYGLILWSHANGWMETSMARSFGQDRKATMKISSLNEALKGTDFSFIYFDCCSMATIEVVWELRNHAPVMVASGTELPADGMPYDLTLPHLFAKGTPDVEAAARTTFEHYNALSSWRRTCTITVVNTKALDELAEASADIFAGVTDFPDDLYQVQPYFRSEVVTYMYDFEDYIERLNPTTEQLERWRAALSDVIIYRNATPYLFMDISIDRYCGLGCYVIRDTREINAFNYNARDWYRDVVSRSPLLSGY